MRYVYIFLIVLGLFMSTASISHAAIDFSLGFSVQYDFDENGNAAVTKRITLTNLNVNTYPSVYLIDLPDDASNIAAFNEKGKLETSLVTENGRRKVRIPLDTHTIGVHEETNITLTFNTRSFAKRMASGWQIAIPPYSADEHIVSYITTINTDSSWGDIVYASPETDTPGVWNQTNSANEAILVSYGEIEQPTPTPSPEKNLDMIVIGIGVFIGVVITAVLRKIATKHRAD